MKMAASESNTEMMALLAISDATEGPTFCAEMIEPPAWLSRSINVA